MSVYIPGMEMPTEGGTIVVYKINGQFFAARAGKDELFPLIPVPDHGRLIDADALRESIRESIEECHKWADEVDKDTMMYVRISQSLGTFVECSLRAKAAPTILEAEEGE